MLKDITLGQFFPGNTIVHRLDPRTKLMAVVFSDKGVGFGQGYRP